MNYGTDAGLGFIPPDASIKTDLASVTSGDASDAASNDRSDAGVEK